MRQTWIICRREWRSTFDSPVAYIFLIAWTIACLAVLRVDFFDDGQATLRRLFMQADRLLLIVVPALAMRLWAEESRSGTLQLLLTWPLRLFDVVAGKFLAASGLIGLAVLLLLPAAWLVSGAGPLDWAPTLVGFFGMWLLGSAYLAVSCAAASFTSSQVVAYIAALATCGLFQLVGDDVLLKFWPTDFVPVAEGLGFGSRFRYFEIGLVRLADVVYYAGWIVVGLWVTLLSLRRHRRPGA